MVRRTVRTGAHASRVAADLAGRLGVITRGAHSDGTAQAVPGAVRKRASFQGFTRFGRATFQGCAAFGAVTFRVQASTAGGQSVCRSHLPQPCLLLRQ